MATKFNLVAELQLTGPVGLPGVVRKIKDRLKGIKAKIDVKFDGRQAAKARKLRDEIKKTARAIKKLNLEARTAVPALNVLARQLRLIASVAQRIPSSVVAAAGGLQVLTRTTNQATTAAQRFGQQAGTALRRFSAFSLAAGGLGALTFGAISAFKAANDLEVQLIKIAQVSGRTTESLLGMRDTIQGLAVNFGVSANELAEAGRVLAQTGLTAKEVETALKALARTDLAPTFETINDTAEGSIAIMRQFKIEVEDLEGVFSSINTVAGSFAIESSDIFDGIKRGGAVFAAAGGQVDEFIALMTAVRATTLRS